MRRFATAFSAVLLLAAPAAAEDAARHGLSIFGDLKYPADFTHFDYADPNAPKGGTLRLAAVGTYDNLNPFILKGVYAHFVGRTSGKLGGSVFDTLMVAAEDEPDSLYGLIAESVEMPDDRSSATFNIRPEARWHDGTPITAADVAFSFDALMTDGHPQYRIIYRDVEKVEALAERRVRFTFKPGATRDLPLQAATMPVVSKAYFSDKPFGETTLEPPMGSGPYRITDVQPGRSLTYSRVKDYWARDLPVNKGRWNFDTIKMDYYRDRTAELLAFFAGEYDFRQEFTSKSWATEYTNKKPVIEGLILRETLPDQTPSGVQAWFLNTRRDKFSDPRVRAALNYAFDFEWTNENLFFGQYARMNSMFENSPLAHRGTPTAAEAALLEPFRGQVPDGVFGDAFVAPATDGSGNIRKSLRAAFRLLKEAGWTVTDGRLTNGAGEQLSLEFLIYQPTFERVLGPYVKNLERLGIDASIRLVDVAQYQNRQEEYDFDAIGLRLPVRLTPGVELRNFWGSQGADSPGSRNLAGVKNPVVDALIEKIIDASSRPELTTAVHALDRVLMWNHYVVTNWYRDVHPIAYWNRFSRPALKPKYALGMLDTWWFDERKAALTDQGKPVPTD